jgi:hypothetical protein
MCESFESDCFPMAAWRSCHAAALVRVRVRARVRARARVRVGARARARDRVGIRVRARVRLAINPDPNSGPNLLPREADEDPVLGRDGLVDGAPTVRVRVGVRVGARDKA